MPAAVTALASVLVYNFFFTHPRFTFIVADSGQLLNLILLLVVGVVVGQLAAAFSANGPRWRSGASVRLASLFQVSRAFATRR